MDREPAEVLVADPMSFGGVLTAELRQLPWATLNALPFNQGFESDPAGFQVLPARGSLGRLRDRLLWLAYRIMTSPFHRAYNRVRAEVGLPRDPRPYGRALLSDWLVLATGCPVWTYPGRTCPGRCISWGGSNRSELLTPSLSVTCRRPSRRHGRSY